MLLKNKNVRNSLVTLLLRTQATKIIPPSSLASPFSIIVYYNKFVVCYLCFLTSSILVFLRHHVVKQMPKQYCVYIFYDALLRACKKENSLRRPKTARWQRNVHVLGLFCMDIIAYEGRSISFLLMMNLHIICTNALVGDHLVLKCTLF